RPRVPAAGGAVALGRAAEAGGPRTARPLRLVLALDALPVRQAPRAPDALREGPVRREGAPPGLEGGLRGPEGAGVGGGPAGVRARQRLPGLVLRRAAGAPTRAGGGATLRGRPRRVGLVVVVRPG